METCTIKAYEKILIIAPNINESHLNDIFEQSDCSQEIQLKMGKLLVQINGSISEELFKSAFYEELKEHQVRLRPQTIEIVLLSKFIQEKANLGQEYSFQAIKSISGKQAIGFNRNHEVSVDCIQCSSTGEKNIKLNFQNDIQWLTAKIVERTKVLKAKMALPAQSVELDSKFTLEFTEVDSASQFFIDHEKLKFYSINKPLEKGNPLKTSDLVPLQLVKYGDTVSIVAQANNLQVQMEGIARQAGYIGQEVKIFNPRGNKEITGKLIGYKKVEVRL